MNKVILKGRLTATPELKRTATDTFVCDFSIAVNRRFNKEQTDFINCQAWRQTAEFISKYFEKGKEILVVGELHIDKWQKDDETRYSTRVIVDEVYFCGNKNDIATSEENSNGITEVEKVDLSECSSFDDDLPF